MFMAVIHAILRTAIVALCCGGAADAAMALDDWATVLAKAKQEGTVVVHGGPGRSYFAALVTAFNKAYPDIKVQFSGAAGAIETPKVLRERQAGIYAWDVWISGPSGILSTLKPAGVFQPLKPVLRPEVMADDKWGGGFNFGWMDNDQQFVYAIDGTLQHPLMINWDVVPRSSLTTVMDLLKPEFAGKIVWHDPRVSGTGNGSAQTLYRNIGGENLVRLFKHDVTYTINGHQIAEWVVRGRYPVGIGFEEPELRDFQAQGLGKNISPVSESVLPIQQISTGFGGLSFVDRAPHPNAAAVYINWLMSKEGGEAWSSLPRNSRRTDVKPAFPALAPVPGRDYFIGQAEKNNEERVRILQVAKEAIDGK
jgi:ABC-type Fe3+ transport system substrate-binding protein